MLCTSLAYSGGREEYCGGWQGEGETQMPVAFNGRSYGLGSLLALIVLLLCIVFAVLGHALTRLLVLGLIAALALAILL